MQIFQSFAPDVADILRNGGIGIIPTDTVYGLVASLFNQAAVERIYEIKQRDHRKPAGTILIAEPDQIENFVPTQDLLRAEVYWPGPVSVVLDVGDSFAYTHRGIKSLAFRIPDKPELIRLLKHTGPLVSSSANLATQPPAATMHDALHTFRANVDLYVDGGDLSGNRPSKIIRIGDHDVTTLRGNT